MPFGKGLINLNALGIGQLNMVSIASAIVWFVLKLSNFTG